MSQSKPKSVFKQFITSMTVFIVAMILRFTYFTSRKRYTNKQEIIDLFEKDQPFILSIWHNRFLLQYFGYRAFKNKKRSVVAMVSKSNDGRAAELALNFIGVKKIIRGSSSRGGTAGLKELLRAARSGADLAFAIDGPKGPLYEIKGGVVASAKMTGLPILPCTWYAKNCKRMKSWDRMILARPFTVLHFVFGKPIHVPRKCSDEEFEKIREQLRVEMMRINAISKEMEIKK